MKNQNGPHAEPELQSQCRRVRIHHRCVLGPTAGASLDTPQVQQPGPKGVACALQRLPGRPGTHPPSSGGPELAPVLSAASAGQACPIRSDLATSSALACPPRQGRGCVFSMRTPSSSWGLSPNRSRIVAATWRQQGQGEARAAG